MSDSAIEKVEDMASQDRSAMGISFKNRNHEEYEWDNEDCDMKESEMNYAPFPYLPTEFPGFELVKDYPIPAVIEDGFQDFDENDEAAAAEANCDLGETPKHNQNEIQKEHDSTEVDLDKVENVETINAMIPGRNN